MKDVALIVRRFRDGTQKLYGERFHSLVLYGSYARGQAREDSDLDLIVVLKGDVRPGHEIDRMIDLVTDIGLEHGICISAFPVSEEDFRTSQSPLMLNVRREGVSA